MTANNAKYPSIFNDVIGPVMRGPSSSHCAASVRIGHLARDLMDGEIESVQIVFDSGGSLATTHESQGADMGLFGGLLGWEATEPQLAESAMALQKAGIGVTIEIKKLDDPHPNTYHIQLENGREVHSLVALSTGGGMIEIFEIDGFAVRMAGDYYETLLYLDSGGEALRARLVNAFEGDEMNLIRGERGDLIEIKAQRFPEEALLAKLSDTFDIQAVKQLKPVLPVLSRAGIEVPFSTYRELLAYNQTLNLPPWELALHYESARGNISQDEVFERMVAIVDLMEASIRDGLEGTQYSDRILGFQSGRFRKDMEAGRLLDGGMLNRVILYTTAMMEVKSAMGVIVAAPTAGACGGLPGAVIGAAHHLSLPKAEMAKAMLAAGLVGVFIASQATFAAEVAGCQAECGAGSGMAAAALATLGGGSAQQALDAASMALQNILGLICDPVANRVEVPCLGRNVMAASNALSCANMALAGYDAVIPLDEVLEAMYQVGQSLPSELRCTALGGLSITQTSLEIQNKLNKKHSNQEID
jgi:L-serine dehydratase